MTDPAAAGEGAAPASAWSAALAWVQAFLEAGALEGTLLTIVFAVEAPLPAPLACRVAEAGGAQPMLAPAGPDFPPLPRPWQSFQASGPTGLVDVSRACVGLTLQHLPGVTRSDRAGRHGGGWLAGSVVVWLVVKMWEKGTSRM